MSGTMPLTQTYQEAIIGWMFKDSVFFSECAVRIQSSMFVDPKLAEIFNIIVSMSKAFEHQVTESDVKNTLMRLHPTQTEHTPRINLLSQACHVSLNMISRDILESEMVAWIQRGMVRDTAIKMESLLQKKDTAGTIKLMQAAVRELEDVRFAQDDRKEFTIEGLIAHDKLNRNGACTTGNPWFDELILEGSLMRPDNIKDYEDLNKVTKGSLLQKDLTIIIGPSNAGKTTTVVTMMAWNILMGRKVLYISLEEKCENIFRKMFQATSGKKLKEFSRDLSAVGSADPLLRDRINIDNKMKENFHMYEWFVVSERTSERLIAHIEKLHKNETVRTGKGFDMVVVDYPSLLICESTKGSNVQRHTEIAMIYTQFKLMAGRNRFHVVAPAQSNRGGYVAATRGGKEARMLDLADVGGSYDLTTVGDNVITLNRSNEDGVSNVIKFHIAKCRSAPRGTIFCSKTNFGLSRTHGPELASTTLNAGMEKIADDILDQTLGRGTLQGGQQLGPWHVIPNHNETFEGQHTVTNEEINKFAGVTEQK